VTVWPPHPLTPYRPVVINAAITGMIPTTDRVPHVPVTAERIIEDAIACADAGAAIVHLHLRDADQRPDWRREGYAEFIPAIREQRPDLVICVTTSGRTYGELNQRADVLRLEGTARPDMASLTLGSLNFPTGASVNAPGMIRALAETMRAAGVRPELEIFDSGMAAVAHDLLARGVLEPPLYANLLLGSPGMAPGRAGDLAHLVAALPADTLWAAAGIGAFQLAMNAIAIFMGGGVRTGLEDNPYLDWQTREPTTNAAMVARCVEIARVAGRRPATSAEVREWLALEPAPAPGASTVSR
jgi:3-keto-5-aminohexanoate cleavage enzyme